MFMPSGLFVRSGMESMTVGATTGGCTAPRRDELEEHALPVPRWTTANPLEGRTNPASAPARRESFDMRCAVACSRIRRAGSLGLVRWAIRRLDSRPGVRDCPLPQGFTAWADRYRRYERWIGNAVMTGT